MEEKEEGKGRGNEESITRPESSPEPTKNIVTEGKTRLDRKETLTDEGADDTMISE